jgi:hypothetical protein
MIDWVTELEEYKTQIYCFEPTALHYHYVDNRSDTLVITAGDSWTQGGGLDPTERLNQVYGKLLSDHYQSDWINIGCNGWSNSWILLHPTYIINRLKNNLHYKKIYVILTLTENGRDIETLVSHPYDYIAAYQTYGLTDTFYSTVLNDCENRWIDQINEMIALADDRYEFFVGQNFVWHTNVVNSMPEKVCIADANWIEKLADYQQMTRPIRTNLVTGWIFNTIKKINQIALVTDNSAYQKWAIPLIDQATKVNDWLDGSDLNNKKASKHPLAHGHQIWADYIINTIEKNEQRRI